MTTLLTKLNTVTAFLIHKLTKTKTYTKISILLLSGIILGCITPKDTSLSNTFIQYTSSILGYTYFLCWSISFYPQIILNYTRKNTTGLSVDFSLLNVVGFGCYTIYVSFLFWNKPVRDHYHHRFHGDNDDSDSVEISVQSNDVAFAIHAFVLSSVQVGQIIYYQRKRRHQISTTTATTTSTTDTTSPTNDDNTSALLNSSSSTTPTMTRNILHMIHPITTYFLLTCFITCIIYAIFVIYHVHNTIFLDYLYMLSSIKLIITIIKYIPQVVLNYKRKSTIGWNVWNVLLDLSGGLLSLGQLILDAWAMNDFTAITGNWVKFGLSFVSLFFDVIFLVQHYVLYPEVPHQDDIEYQILQEDNES